MWDVTAMIHFNQIKCGMTEDTIVFLYFGYCGVRENLTDELVAGEALEALEGRDVLGLHEVTMCSSEPTSQN